MKRETRKQRPRRLRQSNSSRSRHLLSSSAQPFQQEITVKFMEMLMMVKLYHWKTHSFATHKATDELYAKLNEHIDTFIEVLLGKTEIRCWWKLRINVCNIIVGWKDNIIKNIILSLVFFGFSFDHTFSGFYFCCMFFHFSFCCMFFHFSFGHIFSLSHAFSSTPS